MREHRKILSGQDSFLWLKKLLMKYEAATEKFPLTDYLLRRSDFGSSRLRQEISSEEYAAHAASGPPNGDEHSATSAYPASRRAATAADGV
jgi:hypothetical protein